MKDFPFLKSMSQKIRNHKLPIKRLPTREVSTHVQHLCSTCSLQYGSHPFILYTSMYIYIHGIFATHTHIYIYMYIYTHTSELYIHKYRRTRSWNFPWILKKDRQTHFLHISPLIFMRLCSKHAKHDKWIPQAPYLKKKKHACECVPVLSV